jgi:hypothetical protein
MSTKKKNKKKFFPKWRKKANMADGLSTVFFELKLHSSPTPPAAPPTLLQPPAEKELKKELKHPGKLEAPLHLMNVII